MLDFKDSMLNILLNRFFFIDDMFVMKIADTELTQQRESEMQRELLLCCDFE